MLATEITQYFNTLIVVRPSTLGEYQTASYASSFSKIGSFGYPHGAKNPDWIKNPQFIVRVKGLTAGENSHLSLKIILSQSDKRITDDRII